MRIYSTWALRWIVLPAILLAISIGTASSAFRITRADRDRIEILGSGDGVSIVVTTGRSELLLATGTDRSAFGNAYNRIALGPGARPDVVLLAGSGRALNVPSSAVDLFQGATSYAVHPLGADQRTSADLAAVPSIPRNPIRFTLDQRLKVVVEWQPTEDDNVSAWRAVITRGSTRVAIVSSLADAHLFDWTDANSALIVAGDASGNVNRPLLAEAIIGSADSLASPDEEPISESTANSPDHVVPVRPGSIATLRFVDGGIELSSDGPMYGADGSS